MASLKDFAEGMAIFAGSFGDQDAASLLSGGDDGIYIEVTDEDIMEDSKEGKKLRKLGFNYDECEGLWYFSFWK